MEEIVIAGIGLASTFLTGTIAWGRIALEKRKTMLAENEMNLQRQAMSFAAFLEDWQNTSEEMASLIESTEIDRILILRAWNGSLTPRWTTAVYQMREVGQVPRQYVHFELDTDYVERLNRITRGGQINFTVDELPDSFIKQVYQAEGVTASSWWHIDTEAMPGSEKTSVITYVSFSTHSVETISDATLTRCMLMAGRLKGLSGAFTKAGGSFGADRQ